jgi:glucan phosphoethanolaminetransferase (alkaline phosphatase superfamily)
MPLNKVWRRIGWLELLLASASLLFTWYAGWRESLDTDPRHIECGSCYVAMLLVPVSMLALIGAIAAIRDWRYPLLWQLSALPLIVTYAGVAYLALKTWISP